MFPENYHKNRMTGSLLKVKSANFRNSNTVLCSSAKLVSISFRAHERGSEEKIDFFAVLDGIWRDVSPFTEENDNESERERYERRTAARSFAKLRVKKSLLHAFSIENRSRRRIDRVQGANVAA